MHACICIYYAYYSPLQTTLINKLKKREASQNTQDQNKATDEKETSTAQPTDVNTENSQSADTQIQTDQSQERDLNSSKDQEDMDTSIDAGSQSQSEGQEENADNTGDSEGQNVGENVTPQTKKRGTGRAQRARRGKSRK